MTLLNVERAQDTACRQDLEAVKTVRSVKCSLWVLVLCTGDVFRDLKLTELVEAMGFVRQTGSVS